MGWLAQINFRATSGYVTDPEGSTYCLADASTPNDDYPTTRNGWTFGWTSANPPPHYEADRHVGYDARIAGYVGANNGWTFEGTFRLDLPQAGKYAVGWVAGDVEGNASSWGRMEIWDNTTVVDDFEREPPVGRSLGDMEHIDGSWVGRVNWPDANWPITKELEFSSTILQIDYGGFGKAGDTKLTHLYVEQLPSGGAAINACTAADITTIA
jgi:hypothetical protein